MGGSGALKVQGGGSWVGEEMHVWEQRMTEPPLPSLGTKYAFRDRRNVEFSWLKMYLLQ